MGDIELDNDADLKDIFLALRTVQPYLFDQTESEQLHDASERVAEPRQLGDWITITVDSANKKVHCDCEQFNRYGLCTLSATMRVMQFNHDVPSHCKQVNEGFNWHGKVMRAPRVMIEQNIQCC